MGRSSTVDVLYCIRFRMLYNKQFTFIDESLNDEEAIEKTSSTKQSAGDVSSSRSFSDSDSASDSTIDRKT